MTDFVVAAVQAAAQQAIEQAEVMRLSQLKNAYWSRRSHSRAHANPSMRRSTAQRHQPEYYEISSASRRFHGGYSPISLKFLGEVRIQHHPVARLARAQMVQRIVHLAHGEMLHLRRNSVAGTKLHHLVQHYR